MRADDAAHPPSCPPLATQVAARAGVYWHAAQWSPPRLAELARHLAERGGAALRELADGELLAAWGDTVSRFRDPESPERQALDPALARLSGLSPAGLSAALEAVLGGVAAGPSEELRTAAGGARARGLVVVMLAGNVPALAVQPLLPALLLRLPVLLKSASSEPLFAPAFLGALGSRLPALTEGAAAITWRGGQEELEAPLLARASRVLAYGGRETMASLARRAPGKVVDYGPKLSLAVVASDADAAAVAAGLARDVALFDQRGCLSVQAVYVQHDAVPFAAALAAALAEVAAELPPGPADPVAAAHVHQLRAEAEMRGLWLSALPLTLGTVVVEPLPPLRPSPGLRTVRVHPLADLDALAGLLFPWQGRLQGAALAGERAWQLRDALANLGISRCAPPGELQAADALWHNGGRSPVEVLAGTA
ncbi:MAG TPA: acyl-CoA reductase, partial [Thermoanaerobaculia bacterium]|nr:acyl-CoA reductase [Thermoanaerobaculia bacterium]